MPVTFGASIKDGKIYRGKRRTDEDEERRALEELQSLLNAKHRRACDCEAQVHDLLENCLNCGRLTCVAEGPGKCFHCGNLVVEQEQRYRLGKYIDVSQSFPKLVAEPRSQPSSRSQSKIIDNQFDLASIENQRHLRGEEKQKLRENLEELQAKRYQRKLVLNVDLDNLEAGATSQPLVDDYTSEMQRLQVSGPSAGTSTSLAAHPTLVEVLDRKAKEDKRNKNVQAKG